MLKKLYPLFLLALLTPGCKESESIAKLPAVAGSTGPRTVRTAAVQVRMDRDEIRATGTAAAPATTKVMPVVTGLIKRLPVQEGDVVKRGQVLAVLDQRQYRLTLRQAQVAVEGARVALDATTREKQRFEKLLQQDATARVQYDQISDKFRGAQAQMK